MRPNPSCSVQGLWHTGHLPCEALIAESPYLPTAVVAGPVNCHDPATGVCAHYSPVTVTQMWLTIDLKLTSCVIRLGNHILKHSRVGYRVILTVLRCKSDMTDWEQRQVHKANIKGEYFLFSSTRVEQRAVKTDRWVLKHKHPSVTVSGCEMSIRIDRMQWKMAATNGNGDSKFQSDSCGVIQNSCLELNCCIRPPVAVWVWIYLL